MNASGVDNNAFEEVALSNVSVPPTRQQSTEVNNVSRTKGRFHKARKLFSAPISYVVQQNNKQANDISTMRKWISVAILFLVNLLNYMDRFTIAGVLSDVKTYFSIDDSQAGLLQTVFIVFFMIFAPICAYFGDRYNRKYIMLVGLVIWVSAVLGSSFVSQNHFWIFLLLRGVVGIGEASYAILAPTIIADMFTNVIRSRVLMLFYFAIPVGSGLGFIIGAKVAAAMGSWAWGVRVTPPLGLFCIIVTAIFIQEPERGKAERDQGAEKVGDQQTTSIQQDLVYLAKNKTYIFSTIAYTAVVFVTGTLSWWTVIAMEHAEAYRRNLPDIQSIDDADKNVRSNISLLFGVIMMLGGLIGVTLGTVFAQLWKRGQACFVGRHNARADPLVCLIGSLIACPFLFLGMQMIKINMAVAWMSIFIAVVFLCLNWAVNVDMLLYVVLPKRRALATGIQIFVSHAFGDASGPYLVGLLSDLFRGNDDRPIAHFDGLLHAFFVPTALLIVSAVCFGAAAWTLVKDKERFDFLMGYTSSGGGKVTMLSSKGLENNAFDNKNA